MALVLSKPGRLPPGSLVEVKDERKSLRQLGTYSGRHLLNSRTMADLGGEG